MYVTLVLKYVVVLLVSVLPYLFTLQGDFVFDDSEAIEKNSDVTVNALKSIFFNDFWGSNISSNTSHKSYRPLTILSFRLNYMLSGNNLNSTSFKQTNLLCHIICSLLVYNFYQNILIPDKKKKALDIALVSAVLFSVHPVHVEVVSGIVGRADSLAAISFLLSFLCYQKGHERNCYLYVTCAMMLAGIAMLLKESGITVLGLILLYEVAMDRNMLLYLYPRVPQNTKNQIDLNSHNVSLIRISIVVLSAFILLVCRWMIMGGSSPVFKDIDNPASFAEDNFSKVATYSYIYFLNLLIMVWPQWLCFDWSMGCVPLIRTVLDFRIFFVVIFYSFNLLIISALLKSNVKIGDKRSTILGLASMVLPFLPASNLLFPVGFVIAERILYIPSIGYCLLVGLGMDRIVRRFRIKKTILTLFALMTITYMLRSHQRAGDWQDEYKLFTSALAVCPLNAKVRYNVAKVADARNDPRWALQEYKEAIRLYPKYYQAMNNLGNLLKSEQKFTEAEHYLRMAIQYKVDFPPAWMNLGIVLVNTGRHVEAEEAYVQALKYRRYYPDCYYNLGNLYLKQNKFKSALQAWQEAIHQKPNHVLAWTNLLALLTNNGDIETALPLIPKALAVVSDAASVNFAVANIFGRVDRYEEAETHYKRAIALFGASAKAVHYGNLGVLYHRWKKYELAKTVYKKALEVDPGFKTAEVSLRKLNSII